MAAPPAPAGAGDGPVSSKSRTQSRSTRRTPPRLFLVSVLRCLASRRRWREAAVGRVARRLRGGTTAFATILRTLSRQSCRLRNLARVSWLVTSRRPVESSRRAARPASRARAAAESPRISSSSTRSSTFDATLLTFCPPGPDERTLLWEIALPGTVTPWPTSIASMIRLYTLKKPRRDAAHVVARPRR